MKARPDLVLLLVTVGCGSDSSPSLEGTVAERERELPRVRVGPVAAERLVYFVDAVGELEADSDSQVAARLPGVVEKIHVEEGDEVKVGDPLVELDARDFVLRLRRADSEVAVQEALHRAASAAVSAGKATVEKARANLASAEDTLRRKRGLHEKGYATDEVLTNAGTARDAAAWAMKEAEALLEVKGRELERAGRAVAEAQAAKALAEKAVEDSVIRSPIQGSVVERPVDLGEYVKEGGVVVRVVDSRSLKLRFSVSETEATRVRPGNPARLEVAAFPGRAFPATVFFVSASADPESRRVEVKARIENRDGILRPGTFARVKVPVESKERALVVQETAVIPSEKGFTSYVKRGDVVEERTVSIGLRGDGKVEILSGLRESETVIVEGGHALSDGARVQVVGTESGGGTR